LWDNNCFVSSSGTYFYIGGSLAGFYVHSGSGVGGCHLYNFTTATALPVSWSNYLLPTNDPAYNGNYAVFANILCDHNAPYYKVYRLANGSGGGVTSIHTTGPSLSPCGQFHQVVPKLYFCATCGASIRIVDNVPYAAEPQNADWVMFNP